jgi:nitrogen fixation protein NifU and related proteins
VTGPYRERILAHGKAPHNRGPLDPCDAEATLHNPLCGDRVTLRLRFDGDRIGEARFEARGCAIAIASASMLTGAIHGLAVVDAEALAARLVAAVERGGGDGFGEDLLALAELHSLRARRRCATLPWEALREALVSARSESP